MADYSLIDCCEEHGTRKERINDNGANCSVTLRVDWDNRFALVADVVGLRRAWPALTAWTRPPRARDADVVPDGAKGFTLEQELIYQSALVTINYDSEVEDPSEDEDQPELIITETLEPNQEFLTLDYRKFRWDNAVGDPLVEGEAPGRPLYSMNLVRDFQRWEPPLPAELLTGIGHVHDEEYVCARLGMTFAADTLLFIPPVLKHDVTTAGSEAFQGSIKFAYKPEGWNKFWRASKDQYAEIWSTDLAAVYENYPSADLSALLF
jgi:hypothetical protein